jgi:hypothetical protein
MDNIIKELTAAINGAPIGNILIMCISALVLVAMLKKQGTIRIKIGSLFEIEYGSTTKRKTPPKTDEVKKKE